MAKHRREPKNEKLEIGQRLEDGTLCAGITNDGLHYIIAMPHDITLMRVFNDAKRLASKLNADYAFDHNDWRVPDLEELRIMQKNSKVEGLSETFNLTGKISNATLPGWYWSSTPSPDNPDTIANIRFSDGAEYHTDKDSDRLNCRYIRLVNVPR
jgi:hypothetical protein